MYDAGIRRNRKTARKPNRSLYRSMSKTSRFPLIEEIALKSSMPDTFELFRNEPFSFFLDSGMDPHKLGKYSFIGSDPYLLLRSRGSKIDIIQEGKSSTIYGNPFDLVNDLLKRLAATTET